MWQGRHVSPGLAQCGGSGEEGTQEAENQTPPCIQTLIHSAIHSFTHSETKPATRSLHTGRLTSHTQGHRSPAHAERSGTDVDTGMLTDSHSHTLTESQTHVFSHRHSSDGPWGIVCCGYVTACRDTHYG